MPYKPEVIADSSGKWVGNALVFETKREAEEYVQELAFQWMAVRATRVVLTPEVPNYRWDLKLKKLVKLVEEVKP